jgi:hypothetical protein
MPDWITHLGGGYLLYRPISRKDIRLFLLGAILPDFFSRGTSILEDVFHLVWPRYYQLEAFHTPLMLFLVAVFVALFNTNFLRCLGLVFSGSLLHLVLDMNDTKLAGFGQLLLYPFSYKTYQLNLVNYQGWGYYLVVICLFILLISHVPELRINSSTFRLQRIGWAIPMLALILILPYATWQQFWRHNVGYIVFRHYPDRFENQEVAIIFSRVISDKPLVVEEYNRNFELVTDRQFQTEDWISVRGMYRQGKIYPERIKLESGREKIWLSLIGLLLFPFLWFGLPTRWSIFRRS